MCFAPGNSFAHGDMIVGQAAAAVKIVAVAVATGEVLLEELISKRE